MRSTTPDPLRTAALRGRVLDAWTASPARFREDANAEEELVRGAYRDRVVVELAQNAADAATAAGVPGRLLLRYAAGTLVAANTGAPLDASGAEGLSTLRASAKRDDVTGGSVGRFGVGFAAVLAVTDAPSIVSSTGGLRWSRSDAFAAAAEIPDLTDELARRGDAVPVLRLPFSATGDVPDGYDTAVTLPLRDDAADALVRELLGTVDDALLLTLPGLTEVVVDIEGEVRTLRSTWSADGAAISDDGRTTRWRLVGRDGPLPAVFAAGRPVEEPDVWSATVAVPVDTSGQPTSLPPSVPAVVHAPTPTDERSALPVLALASWPMDSSRRRIVPGPLTDFLAEEVAAAYAELVADLAVAGPSVLALVPAPMPAGELDATLHRAVIAALSRTAFVPAASRGAGPGSGAEPVPPTRLLRPDEIVLIDGARAAADPAALAAYVSGLPDPAWWRSAELRRLGAREVRLDEVIDSLADLTLEPGQWRQLYAALDGADVSDLQTLPVPLADGRTVRSARGVLLPTGEVDPDAMAQLGLRVAAPDAVHPLLTRLGATEANAASVLRDPAIRAAVAARSEEPADQVDEDDARRFADAILALVASAPMEVTEPWLADLLLPDAHGEFAPAGELWLPGTEVLAFLDVEPADYLVADEFVRRWGRPVLEVVGVQSGFSTVEASDLPLHDDGWPDLPDLEDWLELTRRRLGDDAVPPILAELVAVRDLDLVRDDAWADVLARLAADPVTLRALTTPAHILRGDGSRVAVTSYQVWWLGHHAAIDGRVLAELCAAEAEPIVRMLLTPAPAVLTDQVAEAFGLARTLDDLIGTPEHLLERLADPGIALGAAELGVIYQRLAAAGVDPAEIAPPDRIRVADGGGTRVIDADDALVADGPQWLQLDLPGLVPGPSVLSDLLDLDLVGDVHGAAVDSDGAVTDVPDVAHRILEEAPATYREHDDLVVDARSVGWWVDVDGDVHAASLDGLARGLCWVAGQWHRRTLLAAALHEPESVATLLAERAYE
jgi:hypothetical protein